MQVYLAPDDRKLLDALARATGLSRAEILRRGIRSFAAIERWLRRFADEEFSLTDAVSFEVMRRGKLRRALTLDRHFAAAGYEVVPGS